MWNLKDFYHSTANSIDSQQHAEKIIAIHYIPFEGKVSIDFMNGILISIKI